MSEENKLGVQLALLAYGGVLPRTLECWSRDLIQVAPQCRLAVTTAYNDADVGRTRGRLATNFLNSGPGLGWEPEVLIMIDHDLTWQPGDVLHLARACAQTKGIVGGVVSLRAFGEGVASRWKNPGTYQQGVDTLMEGTYVGSAFMAAHRNAFEAIIRNGLLKNHDGWWPFFLQGQAEHPAHPGAMEHLSEDWAFCRRAIEAGVSVHIDMRPIIEHHGHYGFSVRDSQQKLDVLYDKAAKWDAHQAAVSAEGPPLRAVAAL